MARNSSCFIQCHCGGYSTDVVTTIGTQLNKSYLAHLMFCSAICWVLYWIQSTQKHNNKHCGDRDNPGVLICRLPLLYEQSISPWEVKQTRVVEINMSSYINAMYPVWARPPWIRQWYSTRAWKHSVVDITADITAHWNEVSKVCSSKLFYSLACPLQKIWVHQSVIKLLRGFITGTFNVVLC